ncbi:hypothetical protein OL229_08115 [Neisseriaceae bacterium JH1-16]|nr:hypothetical protein [Neisseriaceae bacterium JH1-16]
MQKRRVTPNEAAANLRLLPKVTFSRAPLPNGVAYVFQHAELGQQGRMRVEGTPSGETSIVCEVAGFEADPMFVRRRKILEPLSLEITRVCIPKSRKPTFGAGDKEMAGMWV